MNNEDLILPRAAAEKLEQPGTMDNICTHILQGGSLVDLAETWEIPFGWIRQWMAADEERDRAYALALNRRAEFEGEKIKRELARIAYADFRKIYTTDGKLLPYNQWPADVAAAVVGVEYRDGKLIEFKRADKIRALELAGKTIGVFSDKIEMDGTMTLEAMLSTVDKIAREKIKKPVVIEEGTKP
jgi:hypothetical protein